MSNLKDNSTVKEWVKALRSGKYKQTTGTLCSGEAYCCLGVLCKIQDPEAWDTEIGDMETANIPKQYNPGLPVIALDHLAELNDAGHPFDWIADFIETRLDQWIEKNLRESKV